MNRRDLEDKIAHAYSSLTAPDVLDSVLSHSTSKKGAVIPMKNAKRNYHLTRWAGIAAAFVLVLGTAGIYNTNYAVASTVSLDVNPSLEIQTNRKDRVLAVSPNNDDGRRIIDDMDFRGSDLDVAVNALIGSMVRQGYISELSNSVLLSVDSADTKRGQELEAHLTEEIRALLQTDDIAGSVLSQTISEEGHSLQTTADEYGITLGKAQLIQEIIDQDSRYTFDTLAALSINELNLIHRTTPADTAKVSTSGAASETAYIGGEAAKTAALEAAGLTEDEVVLLSVEYDYERGVMVYEIDFNAGSYEYSYDINALTGEVVKWDRELDDDGIGLAPGTGNQTILPEPAPGQNITSSSYIDPEEAKTIALEKAGVAPEDAIRLSCELDEDDGAAVYDIEFRSGLYEYSFEIDAISGSIREWDKELD